MSRHNPDLVQVKLADLRPTQLTVGYAEVAVKRRDWEGEVRDKRPDFLISHCFPGVLGPNDHIYITDHHHLGLALIEAGVDSVFVTLAHDLSGTSKSEFWTVMDHLQLVHPYDAQGERRPFDDIPKRLVKLSDDPYRSLAGGVRESGGYAKDLSPFAEFLWADFFRRRIAAHEVTTHPRKALKQALDLCHGPEAAHLPGWSAEPDKH